MRAMARRKNGSSERETRAVTQDGTEATGEPSHAELARNGDVEALFALMDLDSSTDKDRIAYKWLCAASDFGHEEADDYIDDLLEVSSLRYDDDGYEVAAAHWELAVAYLAGEEGLPHDLVLASKHLDEAFRLHDLDAIAAGTGERYEADQVLARLMDDARKLLASYLAGRDP
jgi:TPR repeat protein